MAVWQGQAGITFIFTATEVGAGRMIRTARLDHERELPHTLLSRRVTCTVRDRRSLSAVTELLLRYGAAVTVPDNFCGE